MRTQLLVELELLRGLEQQHLREEASDGVCIIRSRRLVLRYVTTCR